ncbi:MAG: hypothetical protein LBI86_02115 [Treponema sp.]|jgi:hypothetical protein|nr:hypothetical protein [Treponema sp.]
MREIVIPELVAAFFLFFPLVQPFIKGLWDISGISWLPPTALLIVIGIFPAYGWRPECVPLFAMALLSSLVFVPPMFRGAVFRPERPVSGDFRKPGLYITIPGLVLLAGAVFTALFFSPAVNSRFTSEGVREVTLRNGEREYFLRIYGEIEPSAEAKPGQTAEKPRNTPVRPFIFLIPPEGGSVPAVDPVCAGLRDRGFTVISYSRRGFDSPAAAGGRTYPPSLLTIRRIWRNFRLGAAREKINAYGRALETGRREDIDFLLPLVTHNYLPEGSPLFLAGYSAGGGALVYRADAGFAAAYAAVKGIIAIESPLWSVFQGKERVLREIPENSPWFTAVRIRAENWFAQRKPRVLVPGTVPRPALPVLYLMSDRILDKSPGKNRYDAVYTALRNAVSPAALAAVEGAGPLDYTGYPVTHPVYRVLFPGTGKTPPAGRVLVDSTIAIITNFAALLSGDGAEALDLRKPGSSVHLESRSWTLPDFQGILTP